MSFDFSSLINKFNPDPKKAGSILLFLNAAGMVLASASDTVASATDKNTSPEDKKFLIPAGIATGVARIGLYYTLTTSIINKLAGRDGVKKDGAIKKKEIIGVADTILGKETIDGKTIKGIWDDTAIAQQAKIYANSKIKKAEQGFLGTGLFKKSVDKISSMKTTFFNQDGSVTEDAIKEFKNNFKGGFSVLGAFVGAVVCCSILTPIIRDISAYFVQKKAKSAKQGDVQRPIMPYFNMVTPNGSKVVSNKPYSMNTYLNVTNSNLKI